MMLAVKAASSSGVVGSLRCVDRCCPRTRQARLSGTPSSATTWSRRARRRAGPRSFPWRPRQGSACRASDRTPPGEAARSPSQAASDASPGRPSTRRTHCASDSRSLPSPRSSARPQRQNCLTPSTHRPAEASRRSLPLCVSSVPSSQSSSLKTILQGGPVQGGAGHASRGNPPRIRQVGICSSNIRGASCHLPVKSGNGRPAWHDFNRVDRERCLPRRLPLLRVFAAIRQAYDKASPSAGYLKACLSVGSKRPSKGN